MNKEVLIHRNQTVKEALKQLDKVETKTLLVINDDGTLIGSISDGDIRRYILKGEDISKDISKAYNAKPTYVREREFVLADIKQTMLSKKIELIPIVDELNKVVDYITWEKAFSSDTSPDLRRVSTCAGIQVVIMAGGKGTRLDPFTKIFPKPLFPIEDKTITEVIIEEFRRYGINDYYLTLNYKGAMIESYFNSINKDYNLEYIKEQNFLGTAGSLKLLEEKIKGTFLVSNCDIIVKAKYDEVLAFHKQHEASITILSSMQHYKIPYGIISFENGGAVTKISEKPEYTFTVNTGVYVLDEEVLSLIPKDTYFDMTDLIHLLIKNNKKVVTYPVNENDYVDIGQWDEYRKAISKFKCEL